MKKTRKKLRASENQHEFVIITINYYELQRIHMNY